MECIKTYLFTLPRLSEVGGPISREKGRVPERPPLEPVATSRGASVYMSVALASSYRLVIGPVFVYKRFALEGIDMSVDETLRDVP